MHNDYCYNGPFGSIEISMPDSMPIFVNKHTEIIEEIKGKTA